MKTKSSYFLKGLGLLFPARPTWDPFFVPGQCMKNRRGINRTDHIQIRARNLLEPFHYHTFKHLLPVYDYRSLGCEFNGEIVLFRACVRTPSLVAWWNWISKKVAPCALSPFWGDELSLSPFPHPPNLLSNFSWAYR